MSECSHNCSECAEKCSNAPAFEPLNSMSSVKKVIGVVSGKGGVGKTLVTSLLAVAMHRLNNKVAILDADITGSSIPRAFGVSKPDGGDENGIYPAQSKNGIEIMGLNLLLENESDPVIWRGPIIGGTVKQFWTDVVWGDVDYMFVDMPPGTGDVPLTVFQSIPVDGIIIVTSPQDLVSMIVEKAVKMANMMNIPILGLVENMSYFKCPDCGKEHHIYGEGNVDKTAARFGIKNVASLAIDPNFAALCDAGKIEECELGDIEHLAKLL